MRHFKSFSNNVYVAAVLILHSVALDDDQDHDRIEEQ